MRKIRILAIGDYHHKNSRILERSTKYALEWFHTGPGEGPPPDRAFGEVAKDLETGQFDLVAAFENPFPFFNPRKGWFNNAANVVWNGARRPHVFRGLLATRLYPRVKTRLVALDFSDSLGIQNSQFGLLRHCHLYFKRELPQNPCNAFLFTTAKNECSGNVQRQRFFAEAVGKLRPISLGIEPHDKYDALSTLPKTSDLFYAGRAENRPLRERGWKQLEGLKEEGLRIDLCAERLPKAEFLRRCASALLVWSPEGFGWDCYRDYEAALCGSAPVKNFPTICRHAPLLDGVHALYYGIEGNQLQTAVRGALGNRARCAEIGRAARQHVLGNHTYEALADYLVAESLKD